MFGKLQIIHFTVCFEFIMFLMLRESTDRQTSCLLETHTHTVRLYDRRTAYIVQAIFNVIRFDNRHNRITHFLYLKPVLFYTKE